MNGGKKQPGCWLNRGVLQALAHIPKQLIGELRRKLDISLSFGKTVIVAHSLSLILHCFLKDHLLKIKIHFGRLSLYKIESEEQ